MVSLGKILSFLQLIVCKREESKNTKRLAVTTKAWYSQSLATEVNIWFPHPVTAKILGHSSVSTYDLAIVYLCIKHLITYSMWPKCSIHWTVLRNCKDDGLRWRHTVRVVQMSTLFQVHQRSEITYFTICLILVV